MSINTDHANNEFIAQWINVGNRNNTARICLNAMETVLFLFAFVNVFFGSNVNYSFMAALVACFVEATYRATLLASHNIANQAAPDIS